MTSYLYYLKMDKIITQAEFNELLKTRKVIILFNAVYDVTNFMEGHPGGGEILSAFAGQDATEKFVATGHIGKKVVIDMMSKMRLGKLESKEKI